VYMAEQSQRWDLDARQLVEEVAHLEHPDRPPEESAFAFACRLAEGTLAHRKELDQELEAVSREWPVHRMAAVDRAILRVGAYELRYEQTPVAVVVTEAVEMARRYSTADSPRFVHGVLGALSHPKPGWGQGDGEKVEAWAKESR
jgi:N utilization substance protein B